MAVLLAFALLGLAGGCARMANVSPQEAARRPQDKIVAFGMNQVVAAVTLPSGERVEFNDRGAAYDYGRKMIVGTTADGSAVEYPLGSLAGIELLVPGDSTLPPRTLHPWDAQRGGQFAVADSVAKLARPVARIVPVSGRTGTVDTLGHSARGVGADQQPMEFPTGSIAYARLRVLPSIYSRRAVGVFGVGGVSSVAGDGSVATVDPESRTGLAMGLMAVQRLSDRFALQAELSWATRRSTAQQTAVVDGAQIRVVDRLRVSLYEIALLGKYRLADVKSAQLSLVAGPYLAFTSGATSQFDSTYVLAGFVIGESGERTIVNLKNTLTGGQVGIELAQWAGRIRPVIGLRYTFGYTSLFGSGEIKDPSERVLTLPDSGGIDLKLSGFSISAGFTIPF